jgi:hypothetical protein
MPPLIELAPGVSITPYDDGTTKGISALDLVQCIRWFDTHNPAKPSSPYDREKEREAASKAIRRCDKLQGLPKLMHNGFKQPILTTREQFSTILNMKPYKHVEHAFRAQYQASILNMLSDASPSHNVPTYFNGLDQVRTVYKKYMKKYLNNLLLLIYRIECLDQVVRWRATHTRPTPRTSTHLCMS